MKEFEFIDSEGDRYRVRLEHGAAHLEAFCEFNDGPQWIHQTRMPYEAIRALLSRDTEREKIFAEAMDLARALADVLGSDVSKEQLDAIAARWQATT